MFELDAKDILGLLFNQGGSGNLEKENSKSLIVVRDRPDPMTVALILAGPNEAGWAGCKIENITQLIRIRFMNCAELSGHHYASGPWDKFDI